MWDVTVRLKFCRIISSKRQKQSKPSSFATPRARNRSQTSAELMSCRSVSAGFPEERGCKNSSPVSSSLSSPHAFSAAAIKSACFAGKPRATWFPRESFPRAASSKHPHRDRILRRNSAMFLAANDREIASDLVCRPETSSLKRIDASNNRCQK